MPIAEYYGPKDQGVRDVRGDAAHVAQACHASLERLGVDHIDLYYLHRVDRARAL
jgi:aryl-alcohol dehydrogenase-like predicted oxidoreductase